MWISCDAVPLWLLQLQVRVHLRVLWGLFDATVTEATVHSVATQYLHSTLNSTPTCSNHSVTDETQVASREEIGGVVYKGRENLRSCIFPNPR